MTTTDTTVNNLIINTMTQAQYSQITPSNNELYLVTDSTITSSEVTSALGYTPANTTLSNLSSTTSINFDGQIIFKYVELLSGTPSATDTSINLKTTGYLPNDNYQYEVLVNVNLRTTTTEVQGRVGNNSSPWDDPPTDFAISFRVNTNSRLDYQNAWLPLNADGIIYYQTSAKPNTGIIIALIGYRRIGTNS